MKEILSKLNRLRLLFSRKDKIQYLLLFFMMVVGALFSVVGLGVIPAFVAVLALPDKVMAFPVVGDFLQSINIDTQEELVWFGCAVLALVFLLKNAYMTFLFYTQFRIVENHRVRLADKLFSAYIRAPYVFHLQRNSAELLRNTQAETMEIIRGIILPLLGITMGLVMTTFIMSFLMVVTPWVAILGVGFLALGSTILFRTVRTRLSEYGIEAKRERREMMKAINQGLGALVDARILGKENYLIRAYHRSATRFAHVDRLRQIIKKAGPVTLEIIAVFGLLLIIITLVSKGMPIDTLIPTLALFGASIIRLRQTISMVVTNLSQIQYSAPSIDMVMDDLVLLDSLSHKRDITGSGKQQTHKIPFHHEISLEGVTFFYPNTEKPALKDISLHIDRGESVAFVGATGSGKSTLVNTILGLLHPQEGKIRVDGQDIHDDLRGWLNHVGYIPQFIYLMDESIEENIAFGYEKEEIDRDLVWNAIRAAQLEPFVQTLPEGLDTRVGERGVRLSGGQRQRIGLARALYHNPDVLVMDEATSSLDNKTENLVMQALEELKENRTQIIIAHRLSTVKKCDRLYFLEHGRIVAAGNYEELIQRHAGFKAMAEIS